MNVILISKSIKAFYYHKMCIGQNYAHSYMLHIIYIYKTRIRN